MTQRLQVHPKQQLVNRKCFVCGLGSSYIRYYVPSKIVVSLTCNSAPAQLKSSVAIPT